MMKAGKSGDFYFIRLFTGESLIKTLTDFCQKKEIHAGILHGIGAVLEAEVAFYDLSKKKYLSKKFREMEICSLTGNIALVEGKPFLHCHAVLSDKRMSAFGGHLKEAIVGATCEIVLKDLKIKMEREMDEETGLNLLDVR